jgi:hypothetical protein
MSESTSLSVRRAGIARAARQALLRPDDPSTAERVASLRGDYTAAKLAECIASVVSAAPPLTDEQRDHLVTLLRGSAA